MQCALITDEIFLSSSIIALPAPMEGTVTFCFLVGVRSNEFTKLLIRFDPTEIFRIGTLAPSLVVGWEGGVQISITSRLTLLRECSLRFGDSSFRNVICVAPFHVKQLSHQVLLEPFSDSWHGGEMMELPKYSSRLTFRQPSLLWIHSIVSASSNFDLSDSHPALEISFSLGNTCIAPISSSRPTRPRT